MKKSRYRDGNDLNLKGRGPLIHLITILLLGLLVSTISVSGYGYAYFYQNLDGEQINLQSKEGEYILIEFMTTWCESCKLEALELKDVYEAAKDKFEMISIGVDLKSDTLEKLREYKGHYQAGWEFGLDYQETFRTNLNIESYPSLIFLNGEGKIISKWIGLTSAYDILEVIGQEIEITHSVQENMLDNMSVSLVESLITPIIILAISISTVVVSKYIRH